MKAVQTFWSGNKDPLRDSFGWIDPQYNLMSWALSCLSLRELYDEVIVYTDSKGRALFSELLDLPYTNIIVEYDNLVCPEHQWAYSKILTYSLQKEPFIHVDGDVYLPKRLNPEIEKAGLIAQNREIGTEYYKKMIDAIKENGIITPDFLEKELQKESISSYNAGVLGGNDIKFIQEYCQAAFDFINSNQLLDMSKKSDVSHNILFEQILFYAFSSKYKKKVTTVIKDDIEDEGYTYRDFCNFYSYDNSSLMHIIGGHKRQKMTCELLSRTLLKKYPEYYQRIIELFPEKHKRITPKSEKAKRALDYEKFVNKLSSKWEKIPNIDLFRLERKTCDYFDFLNNPNKDKQSTVIKRNPYLSIYEKRETNDSESITGKENYDMACIPTLLSNGFHTVAIDDLCYNILTILEKESTLESLLIKLEKVFLFDEHKDKQFIFQSVLKGLEYLFYNKLIYVNN